MNRGALIVTLLIGLVIGYLAGVGLPGLEQTNDPRVRPEQESISDITATPVENAEPEKTENEPVELHALDQAEWLQNDFLPMAAIAYAKADLDSVRQPINGSPTLAAMVGAPGLQSAWEQAAMASFGPAGAHVIPLIEQCAKLNLFLLPSTLPAVPCDVLLYAQLSEIDINQIRENILNPISQAVPGSSNVVESVSGYPIYGVRGDSGELMALAESGGLWIANHRSILENLVAAQPGAVTSTVPPIDTPLFSESAPWLTVVVRRPPGPVSIKDPLAWVWNAPWQIASIRIEEDARESGSTIAAAFSIGDETTTVQEWTPCFVSSVKRTPVSLGQLGVSLPSFMNGERRGGRRDRARRNEEDMGAPHETTVSPQSSDTPAERNFRDAVRRRMERRGFAPPVQSFVMDWIDTGKPEPAWMIQVADADGGIQQWFKAMEDGSSPLADSLTVESVNDGAAAEFVFQGGPFVEWFGLDRFLVSYELPNGVVLFQDEAILDELPALLAPIASTTESSEPPQRNLYAYADLSPELLLALIVFESGGPKNAEPMMAFLKPFVSALHVQVVKEDTRFVFRSTAEHSPGNWIGLTALGNAFYLYMNR